MAIASQYIRGRKKKIEEILKEYYLYDDGDCFHHRQDTAEVPVHAWTITKSAAATVSRSSLQAKIGDKSLLFDTTPANNLEAKTDLMAFDFTPVYPYRFQAYVMMVDRTNMVGAPHLLGTRNAADQHVHAVYAAFRDGPYLSVDYEEGFVALDEILPLNAWKLVELIAYSDTVYYVEINGTKYGPFTVRYSGPVTQFSYMGDADATADRGQLKMFIDGWRIYKKEDTYDPTGATAPTRVHYWRDDLEYPDGITMLTIATAGGGTIQRSQAEAWAGSWSLECDTRGDGSKAATFSHDTVPWPLPVYEPSYPIWHQCRFKVKQIDVYGSLHIIGLGVGGDYCFYVTLHDEDMSLDIFDGAWNYDYKTISLDTWYKIAVKEISDTEAEVYVDDVAVATGMGKGVEDRVDGWYLTGAAATVEGAWLAYWDRLEWFREL